MATEAVRRLPSLTECIGPPTIPSPKDVEWNVDRLGRSLKDLVAFLSELHALDIDLFLHQQGLDTTTSAGKAFRCSASLLSSSAR